MTAEQTHTDKQGMYVYCVARAGENHPLGPIGLDGHEAYTVAGGDIQAVVHDCKPEPYQSDDRQTVEGWVVAHQRVIEAATEALGTVLPMSFNMIVRENSDRAAGENLQAWLEEKRDGFIRLLDKFTGKAEYGVQIFWDRQLAAESLVKNDPELRKMQDGAKNKPKGLAYMLKQKLAKATRAALEKLSNQYVEGFYGQVRQCVDDVRVEALKKADNPRAPAMLLNLCCLMEKGSGTLGQTLEEIQKTEAVSVRFTGPWPPYSFVVGG